jgi:hypothetical protein
MQVDFQIRARQFVSQLSIEQLVFPFDDLRSHSPSFSRCRHNPTPIGMTQRKQKEQFACRKMRFYGVRPGKAT